MTKEERARGGRVVITPGADYPYKVILDYPGSGQVELPVGSVRDGEALIRARTGAKSKRPGLREWNPLG
jgi:hypothetical protein